MFLWLIWCMGCRHLQHEPRRNLTNWTCGSSPSLDKLCFSDRASFTHRPRVRPARPPCAVRCPRRHPSPEAAPRSSANFSPRQRCEPGPWSRSEEPVGRLGAELGGWRGMGCVVALKGTTCRPGARCLTNCAAVRWGGCLSKHHNISHSPYEKVLYSVSNFPLL